MAKKKKKKPSYLGCVLGGAFLVLFLLCGGGAGAAVLIYLWNQPGGLAKNLSVAKKEFDDTPAGLEKQIQGVVAENRSGGSAKVKEMLQLPEHWFDTTFGPEQGKQFAAKYRDFAADRDNYTRLQLEQAKKMNTDKIQIDVYRPDQPLIKKTFSAMQSKATFHNVALVDSTGKAFWDTPVLPCVYVDGRFRFFHPAHVWPK